MSAPLTLFDRARATWTRLRAGLVAARRPTVVRAIETAVLVALVPAVGALVNRADPLFVQSSFPWPVLVAVVVALRYGFAAGFTAAASWIFLVVGAWKGALPLTLPVDRFPAERAVGTIVVAMLVGEFSDAWTRRLAGLARSAAHGQQRFDAFSRAYQVLRLSHDTLERRASAEVASLREGLRAVRELAEPSTEAGARRDGSARDLARAILELFVQHAEVRLGSVFLGQGDGKGDGSIAAYLGRPLAAFGTEAEASDPLIEEAWRLREAVGFEGLAAAARAATPDSPASGGGSRRTELVLALPLVDVDGVPWGLVAIRDLPFSAYSAEHRQRLVVLAGYVGDLLAFGGGTDGAEATIRRIFTRDLQRAVHDQRAYGITAAMVRLDVAPTAPAAVSRIVLQQRRATDRVLRTSKRGGGAVLNVLLPFTDEEGIARYLQRIEAQLRLDTGASLADSGVEIVTRSILHEEATRRVVAEIGQSSS